MPSQFSQQGNAGASGAQAEVAKASKVEEKAELEQVNALYSFLENRYSKKVRLRRMV